MDPNNPAPANAEAALGITAASGFGPNVLPVSIALSTAAQSNYLLKATNYLRQYPSKGSPSGLVTRLQAACATGNLAKVQDIVRFFQINPRNTRLRAQLLQDEGTLYEPLVLAELGGHEPVVRYLFSLNYRPAFYNDYLDLLTGAFVSGNDGLVNALLQNNPDAFPYLTFVNEEGNTVSSLPPTPEYVDWVKREVFYRLVNEFKTEKGARGLRNFFRLFPELYPQIASEITFQPASLYGPAQTLQIPQTFFDVLVKEYEFYRSGPDPKTPWMTAIEELILDGLQHGANPNAKYKNEPILYYFLSEFHFSPAIVNELLSIPATDVNATGYGGQTALYTAVSLTHDPNIVYQLLRRGATEIETSRDETILGAAILAAGRLEGDMEHPNANTELKYNAARNILQMLLDHGFDVNFQGDYGGVTALMFAVESGSQRLVDQILAMPGVDVNATDSMGRTALFYLFDAINKHYLLSPNNRDAIQAIVKRLLAAGLDPNIRDLNNRTALTYMQGQTGGYFPEFIEALVELNLPQSGGRRRRSKTTRKGKKRFSKKTRKV